MKALFLLVSLCAQLTLADTPKPEISLTVIGDLVIVSVRSPVQFKVWHSCNPTSIWWWLYTSPVPQPGQTIVWIGYDSKAGLFPPYNFFRVTTVNTTTSK